MLTSHTFIFRSSSRVSVIILRRLISIDFPSRVGIDHEFDGRMVLKQFS